MIYLADHVRARYWQTTHDDRSKNRSCHVDRWLPMWRHDEGCYRKERFSSLRRARWVNLISLKTEFLILFSTTSRCQTQKNAVWTNLCVRRGIERVYRPREMSQKRKMVSRFRYLTIYRNCIGRLTTTSSVSSATYHFLVWKKLNGESRSLRVMSHGSANMRWMTSKREFLSVARCPLSAGVYHSTQDRIVYLWRPLVASSE